MADALAVYAGREAARRIRREGWSPDLFSLLLGASGGPKWFILGRLDRFLFGDFLQRGDRPLSALGSSIGSWRHACLAQTDPVAAVDRLEAGYLYQEYASRRPGPEEISAVSRDILDRVLQSDGARHLVEHPRIRSHIVTETMDSTNAQIPSQMSRPITFMRVKVWIGASVPAFDAIVWAAA